MINYRLVSRKPQRFFESWNLSVLLVPLLLPLLTATFATAADPPQGFVSKRGDANGDAKVDIADALAILGYLFLGDAEPPCLAAADSNNDDAVDLTDAVTIIHHLFSGDVVIRPLRPEECGPNPIPGLTAIVGPEDALASGHLPRMVFPPPRDDAYFLAGLMPISVDEVLLEIDPLTTVGEVNALLSDFGATIIGAIPGSLILLRLPTKDVAALMGELTALSAEPIAVRALPEIGALLDLLPPDAGPDDTWVFDVPDGYPDTDIVDGTWLAHGNWHLEAMRAPQMWNLDTFVRRERVEATIAAAVIDAGFTDTVTGDTLEVSSHPDFRRADGSIILELSAAPGRIMPPDDHGTMVAGIVGAAWDNGRGVAGVNPWIDRIHGRGMVHLDRAHIGYVRQLDEIVQVLQDRARVRAINCSFGSSAIWLDYDLKDNNAADGSFALSREYGDIDGNGNHAGPGEFPGFDADGDGIFESYRSLMDHFGDQYARTLDPISLARDDFLVVASAGNAGMYPTVSSSPLANAAVRFEGAFLAVENTTVDNRLNPSSSRPGSVAAPGTCVRSTEHNGFGNQDQHPCTLHDKDGSNGFWSDDGTDPGNSHYATSSGTSYSAPAVTGLITALWVLEPTLTATQVRTLVTDSAYTFATTATPDAPSRRVIDAFGAAMGIDALLGRDTLRRALVDVDDGTRDGNRRTQEDAAGARIDYADVPTSDGRRGDGRIGMADFRAFRDALLETLLAAGTLAPAEVSLDGSALHFKRDLNFDGCLGGAAVVPDHPGGIVLGSVDCSQAPGENVFPRYDFNGDGTILPNRAFLPPTIRESDLDVLLSVWPDDRALTEGWPAEFLDALVPADDGFGGSADLLFRTDIQLAPFDSIQIFNPELAVQRLLTAEDPEIVWTVPLVGDYHFEIIGFIGGDVDGEELCLAGRTDHLNHGEDRTVIVTPCGNPPGAGRGAWPSGSLADHRQSAVADSVLTAPLTLSGRNDEAFTGVVSGAVVGPADVLTVLADGRRLASFDPSCTRLGAIDLSAVCRACPGTSLEFAGFQDMEVLADGSLAVLATVRSSFTQNAYEVILFHLDQRKLELKREATIVSTGVRRPNLLHAVASPAGNLFVAVAGPSENFVFEVDPASGQARALEGILPTRRTFPSLAADDSGNLYIAGVSVPIDIGDPDMLLRIVSLDPDGAVRFTVNRQPVRALGRTMVLPDGRLVLQVSTSTAILDAELLFIDPTGAVEAVVVPDTRSLKYLDGSGRLVFDKRTGPPEVPVFYSLDSGETTLGERFPVFPDYALAGGGFLARFLNRAPNVGNSAVLLDSEGFPLGVEHCSTTETVRPSSDGLYVTVRSGLTQSLRHYRSGGEFLHKDLESLDWESSTIPDFRDCILVKGAGTFAPFTVGAPILAQPVPPSHPSYSVVGPSSGSERFGVFLRLDCRIPDIPTLENCSSFICPSELPGTLVIYPKYSRPPFAPDDDYCSYWTTARRIYHRAE